MNLVRPYALFLVALAVASVGHAYGQSVAFIAPTGAAEAFSMSAAKAMEAAAKKLGMPLEIQYAERQSPRAIAIASELVGRPPHQRPDYVIVANELGAGPELLRTLSSANVKTLMAFGGINTPEERAITGYPREKYKNWLGTVEPNPEQAGYITARTLIEKGRAARLQAPDGKLHFLAVGGDKSTTTSALRSEGMRRAVREAPDVVFEQEVSAGFNQKKAEEQTAVLYQRYPTANLIWAGNDLMAFGAMQSWQAKGGKPGKDGLFSAINTSRDAMEMVKDGRLSALAGGHFITGAFALVMLHDYHRGRDFFSEEGRELRLPIFMSFGPKEAEMYQVRFGEDQFDSVDFSRFSKVLNPKLKRYEFRFDPLLR